MENVLVNLDEILEEIKSCAREISENPLQAEVDKAFNMGLDAGAMVVASRCPDNGEEAKDEKLISTREYVNRIRVAQTKNNNLLINEENRTVRWIIISRNNGLEIALLQALRTPTKKFIRKDGYISDELVGMSELRKTLLEVGEIMKDEIRFGVQYAISILDEMPTFTYDGCNFTDVGNGD